MERQYLDLLRNILENGELRKDRTGVGVMSVFGRHIRCDLKDGFPLLTTKYINLRAIICELLWFLRGDTNTRWLNEHGVHIWDKWADENGDLGPIYGRQWRSWPTPDGQSIDQIAKVLEQLRSDPHSRRHIVCAWNVGEIGLMKLPPCHCLFQFYVSLGRLSCQMYQRSADVFLGVPFNIASYALLTMMVAHALGLEPGEYIHTFGDVHIYTNHYHQVRKQLSRVPRSLPTMHILPREGQKDLDFMYDDFGLTGYNPHPPIRAPIAV